jgi:hypothetical protein
MSKFSCLQFGGRHFNGWKFDCRQKERSTFSDCPQMRYVCTYIGMLHFWGKFLFPAWLSILRVPNFLRYLAQLGLQDIAFPGLEVDSQLSSKSRPKLCSFSDKWLQDSSRKDIRFNLLPWKCVRNKGIKLSSLFEFFKIVPTLFDYICKVMIQ